MKTMHQPKAPNRKRTIHWDLLGLQGPAATSIEEIRRQIISASNCGLSPETVARAQNKGTSLHLAAKKPASSQPRGSRS